MAANSYKSIRQALLKKPVVLQRRACRYTFVLTDVVHLLWEKVLVILIFITGCKGFAEYKKELFSSRYKLFEVSS